MLRERKETRTKDTNSEIQKIMSIGYNIFLLLIVFSILWKIIFVTKLVEDFFVELFVLLVGIIYVVGTVCIKGKESLKKAHLQRIIFESKTKGFILMLISMLLGEVVYFYFAANWKIACMYLPVWILPSLYCCIKSMKKQVIVSNNLYDRKKVLRQMKLRTIIGSIVFGVLVFGESVYSNGKIHLSGLLWMLYGTLAFGFLLYFLLKFLIVGNDKKLDDLKDED